MIASSPKGQVEPSSSWRCSRTRGYRALEWKYKDAHHLVMLGQYSRRVVDEYSRRRRRSYDKRDDLF